MDLIKISSHVLSNTAYFMNYSVSSAKVTDRDILQKYETLQTQRTNAEQQDYSYVIFCIYTAVKYVMAKYGSYKQKHKRPAARQLLKSSLWIIGNWVSLACFD